MKSEPEVFSIEDLKNAPGQTDCWDGVRNYQARNFMRDEMKKGDLILFYHSNATPPGVAGIAEVARESYPDHTACDPSSPYYDPKSSPENPRWVMVDVKFRRQFSRLIGLEELRQQARLKNMKILQKGNRLSITPVTKTEFDTIVRLGERQ